MDEHGIEIVPMSVRDPAELEREVTPAVRHGVVNLRRPVG
jgi:hypothetical protein